MRGVFFFLIFACAKANAGVLLDEEVMTIHMMVTGMSGQAKSCADMTSSAIDSPQTSLTRLRANHASLLEKGRQLVLGLTQEQQTKVAHMAQVIGDQLQQLSSGATAEKKASHCTELARWFEHRASASETALTHEEMNNEVEKLFPGRPDACHALGRTLEEAAREFLASLQTVQPREPDIMKTMTRFQTHENAKQAAPKCELLRQRAVRRQIDFPAGFQEMNALAAAIHETTLMPGTEGRTKELATAYLARIRSK